MKWSINIQHLQFAIHAVSILVSLSQDSNQVYRLTGRGQLQDLKIDAVDAYLNRLNDGVQRAPFLSLLPV